MQRLLIRDRPGMIYRVVVSLHNRPIEKYFYSLSKCSSLSEAEFNAVGAGAGAGTGAGAGARGL